MSNVLVRDAHPGDVEAIWNLTRELAVFEHLEDQFVATVDAFHKELFGEDPPAKTTNAERIVTTRTIPGRTKRRRSEGRVII